MKKAFSRPGKIMEIEKKAKIMEKSWNFKMSLWKNHGNFFWAARALSKKDYEASLGLYQGKNKPPGGV